MTFLEVFPCPICIANSRRFVAIRREDSEMSSCGGFIVFFVATFFVGQILVAWVQLYFPSDWQSSLHWYIYMMMSNVLYMKNGCVPGFFFELSQLFDDFPMFFPWHMVPRGSKEATRRLWRKDWLHAIGTACFFWEPTLCWKDSVQWDLIYIYIIRIYIENFHSVSLCLLLS